MINRLLLSYAFTFMLIELTDSASMLIDGIIVSRHLGAGALAATGLADPSFKIVCAFCGLIAVGVQMACSAAMSMGNTEKTKELFSSCCVFSAGLAVLFTVLAYAFLNPVCRFLMAGAENEELFQSLSAYLRGWFVGIPGLFGFTVLCPLVTLDGNRRCVTAATALQSIINIVGDYLSVTVLGLGTFGVGLFTGLGFDLALLLLISSFFRKESSFRLDLSAVRLNSLPGIVSCGLPRMTKHGCKILSPLLMNRIILATGGVGAMAVMSVKEGFGSFALMTGAGIASAVSLMAQVYSGEKDQLSLRQIVRSALIGAAVLCSALGLLLFIFSGKIAGLYMPPGSEEHLMTQLMLRLMVPYIVLSAANEIFLNYLHGTRRIALTNLQTFSIRLVFPVLTLFVFSRIFGVPGIYLSVPTGSLAALAVYLIAVRHYNRAHGSDERLVPYADTGCREEDELTVDVHSVEEVVGISEQVDGFCRSHGIDRRRSYFCSLCVEELAGNVVTHGFQMDEGRHTCVVRVTADSGELVLRIRDDCPYFNVKERYEHLRSKDELSDIGIKLVCGIAKEIRYVNILNTNTCIIYV